MTVVPGTAALLERAGLPLPSGDVPVRTTPLVVVGTPVGHPADLVQVLLRHEGGPPRAIRAHREGPISGDPVQWFRAWLPALEAGQDAEYRVEWSRAGRRMATAPADGSWQRLSGADEPHSAVPLPSPASGAERPPSRSRFEYELEFFATVTADLRPEVVGTTPEGYRINFHIENGQLRGPRIDAVIQPGGVDWMVIRPDGIGMLDIRFTCRTGDAALILEEAGGVIDLGPSGYAMAAAGRLDGEPEFYPTPRWSTAHAEWGWLNRRQGFGFGRVAMNTLQVRCDVYLPHVGGRLAGG